MLKRNSRVSEQGTKRSKETREFRKRLEKLKARANCSKGTTGFQKKEQTARKRLEHLQNKEQTARKDLENFRTRIKPLERDFEKFNRDSRN